jgi:hypothetical protein
VLIDTGQNEDTKIAQAAEALHAHPQHFSMRHDGIRIDFPANGGLRIALRKIQLNTALPKRTLHRHDPNRTRNTG